MADAHPAKRFKSYARSVTMAGVERIRAEMPELSGILGPDFTERTAALFALEDDDWPWKVATSKVASMVDLGARGVQTGVKVAGWLWNPVRTVPGHKSAFLCDSHRRGRTRP